MPTPYGTRGGMAFGTEELHVLRRALALALDPRPASAKDVQDCLRLAESLDEAVREGARHRAFLLADLARYRAALPGTAVGYLALLDEVLRAGHRPTADDLAALGALRGNPAAAALLERCPGLPTVPASRGRARLTALPGGDPARAAGERGERGDRKPAERPAEKPADKEPTERPRRPEKPGQPAKPAPLPAEPKPSRPVPTPGEVFPRRKPPAPPAAPTPPQQRLAVG
ncbi:hypothetical protein AB0F77_21230 [Streptomyces sp. NPDC026672]|uniref:hypothetical protein n=1 Tax=unclassified Streptomyces TaxID=2593676 RepID=UPI0033C68AFB